MTTQTLQYIETRGFHLRGFVGGVLLATCGLAAALSTPAIVFDPLMQTALTAAGWTSFILGMAMRFWATLYVGGRKVGGRREATLTVVGPYSIVRNPLYVGSFLIGLSTALILGSGTLLASLLIAAAYYSWYTVPAEEAFLRRTVGEAVFDDYAARTPRYLPNWSLYQSPLETTFPAKALRNEARRAARLLAVPIAFTLLAALRSESWWPAWFQLP